MKKIISILSLSLMFSFTLMTGNVFAFNVCDYNYIAGIKGSTKSCPGRTANLCLDCDLSGADLQMANLYRKNLSGSDMSGANLRKANLKRTNLTGVNLSGSNLTGSDISRSDLSGANLTGANLTGVNLTETNLTGVNLTGANLTDVIGLSEEIKKITKNKEYEKSLSSLYNMYITLKTCYEVRKGQSYVYIQKTKMDEIKSYTKKFETKLFEEFPHLKSSKDKIWKDTSTETTLNLRNLKSAEYDKGKQLCDLMDYTFTTMAEAMFPPTGEVVEKDF
jgi:hypothetical protein